MQGRQLDTRAKRVVCMSLISGACFFAKVKDLSKHCDSLSKGAADVCTSFQSVGSCMWWAGLNLYMIRMSADIGKTCTKREAHGEMVQSVNCVVSTCNSTLE